MSAETTISAITSFLATIVKGVKILKKLTIRPFTGAEEFKTVYLNIDFEGVSLQQVFNKACSSDVITWQNNNRDKYDKIIDGSTIERKFSAPPATIVSEAEGQMAFIAKLATLDTDEERQAYIEETLKDAKS